VQQAPEQQAAPPPSPAGAPPVVVPAQYGWNGAYPAPSPLPPPEVEERTANNALYVELLGAGLFYSINYDRTFGDFAARVGVGYFSVSAYDYSSDGSRRDAHASFLSIPLSVTYVGLASRNKTHIFELGIGLTILHAGAGANSFYVDDQRDSRTIVIGTGTLGYRLQPADGGFFLRAGINPLLGYGFIPWPYVGLGATF
jgi:hypothetical protein